MNRGVVVCRRFHYCPNLLANGQYDPDHGNYEGLVNGGAEGGGKSWMDNMGWGGEENWNLYEYMYVYVYLYMYSGIAIIHSL